MAKRSTHRADRTRSTSRPSWHLGVVVGIVALAAVVIWRVVSSLSTGDSIIPSASTEIRVSMVGDVIPYGELFMSDGSGSSSFDYDTLYANVKDDISSADVRILSQDTILSDATTSTSGLDDTSLACPTSVGDAEAAAGFNLILKANEHIFDLRYEGLGHEMDFWKDNHPEVTVIGTDNPNSPDRTQDYVDNVYVYEKNGFKVAFLNYTYGINQAVQATDQKYYSLLNATKIERDVERAKKAGADMIVACPHWGEAYSTQLTNEETTYARVFAELGVDVVIGTNPHVLQEVDTITTSSGHKMLCIYSIGDFISNQTSDTSLVGGLASVTLHKDSDGTCSVSAASITPLVIYRDDTTTTTYPLSEYTPQLATTNVDGTLTRSYVDDLCKQVFGSSYDSGTGRCDIVATAL